MIADALPARTGALRLRSRSYHHRWIAAEQEPDQIRVSRSVADASLRRDLRKVKMERA